MARPREPIDLLIAKGKKNLTKAEIEQRRKEEVTPCTDDLTPPSYLTAAEKRRFEKLAVQLTKIKIMGETDVETLARYVSAQTLYEKATKEMRKLEKERPKKEEYEEQDKTDTYYLHLECWVNMSETTAKLQDRYFKQAQTAARDLGLTISSRCKLVAPAAAEAPPENKFSKFRVIGGA
jgi:P27 family predicted phage terminase small subunit